MSKILAVRRGRCLVARLRGAFPRIAIVGAGAIGTYYGVRLGLAGADVRFLLRGDLAAVRARGSMAIVQRAAAAFGIVIADEFCREQFDVTPPMGAYRPSSLVDFPAGREVEIGAIWSEPLRWARAAGVAMPELEKLHAEIQARVVRSERCERVKSGRRGAGGFASTVRASLRLRVGAA